MMASSFETRAWCAVRNGLALARPARARALLRMRGRGKYDAANGKLKTHDAGKARGHASLMRPAKPCPGVSSVGVGRLRADPDVTGAVSGAVSTVASSNLLLLRSQHVA
jgi:hypothetical protein